MLSKLSIVDFLLYFGLLQFVIYWPFQADYWGEHLPPMRDQDMMEQMFNGPLFPGMVEATSLTVKIS